MKYPVSTVFHRFLGIIQNQRMAELKKWKPQFLEELMEADMPVRKPNNQEAKPGPEQKKKFKLMKIDEKELEELRLEVAPREINRDSFFSKGQQKQSQRKSSLFSIKKPISKRTSNGKKDLAEKAVSNIRIVANRSNGISKFISRGSDIMATAEKPIIRKKLFRGISTSDNTLTKTIEYKTGGRLSKVPRINKNCSSPLMDLNTAEKLMEKSTSFKAIRKPTSAKSKNTPLRLSTVFEQNQSLTPSEKGCTSNHDNDDTDFENMENLCRIQENNDTISKILSIIKTAEEEFEKFKEENQKKMCEISSLLQKLNCKNPTNNEILPKKSASKPKIVPKRTPLKNLRNIAEGGNLRQNVLRKSISQATVDTPKHKKAERMYNSLRDKYEILDTPKFDKQSSGESKCNISTKLQEQCLMLLDTPEHN